MEGGLPFTESRLIACARVRAWLSAARRPTHRPAATRRRAAPAVAAPVLAAVLLALGAAPARASEASTIIERCTHGQSLSGFSQNGYREALEQMPTEVREYYCPENLIRKAELATIGGGEAGGGSNVPIPLTPAERRAVLSAHRNGSAPVPVGGKPVRPGVVHANVASAVSALPPSLLTVLAILLAGALALAGGETRRLVRKRRHR